jgi:energy-coupling factor transporter ATP-binding protein EcfA2
MSTYRASKTRSQGRPGWSISLRHPVKHDPRTNSGQKIRRGLGTSDDAKADQMVEEMNQLLSDESWWNVTQRERASKQFSPEIVSAFYDPMEPEATDSTLIRDKLIPMPGKEDGFPRVLFVGTTGAGKTTLLRHLIGSDPRKDRFPSTSTAKTTIADIEVIVTPESAEYEAVVTFFDEWLVHSYVVECVVDAGIAAWERLQDSEIADRLLHHSDQKFRLSYVLGSWKPKSLIAQSEDDWTMESGQEVADEEERGLGAEEQAKCQAFLEGTVSRIKAAAKAVIEGMTKTFETNVTDRTSPDYETYQDIFESEFESSTDDIVKDVIDEIRPRFDEVEANLERRKSGWPVSCHLITNDRDDFIRQIRWFASNHAKSYGQLLTPLVDGIRIKGPLFPATGFSKRRDKLVLIDGQGLGHTADSAATVTTHITSRFGSVDTILLVDNAAQPIQAVPLAALRTVLGSGHQGKLAIAFTHFDQVKGDNLPGPVERRAHVMASVRNGITSLSNLGSIATASFQRGIEERCFMFGYLDHASEKLPKAFVGEADRLLNFFRASIAPAEVADLQPSYDLTGVGFAVQEATQDFNRRWAALLGTGPAYGDLRKQHWARVKALSRRFASQSDIEYDNLMPVADLVSGLQEAVLRFLEKPLSWSRAPEDESEAESVLSAIRQQVSEGMHSLARTRIAVDQLQHWVEAYHHRGKGSAADRSRQVMNIYVMAAPIPGTLIDRVASEFLQEVRDLVRSAIEDNGGRVESLERRGVERKRAL